MIQPVQDTQLNLQALPFDYSIVRSNRKTAAIYVGTKGVQVRIPHGVSDGWVEEFVVTKKRWIEQKLLLQKSSQNKIPNIELGQKVLYLGKWRELSFQYSGKSSMVIEDQLIIYYGPEVPDNSILKLALQNLFKQKAKQYMVAKTSEKARALKVIEHLQQVVFRRTKSKWGHCTSRGRIQYNWLIMGAPLAVIDYLICHEVSHLIQANHSRAFWSLVEKLSPDYKNHQQWLNDHAAELSWC